MHATRSGDRLVLTTDGVHAVVDKGLLGALLVGDGEPESVATAIEDAVLAAGAPDNYGIVVVDIG